MRRKVNLTTILLVMIDLVLIIASLNIAPLEHGEIFPHASDKGDGGWIPVTETPWTGGFGECVVSDGKYIYVMMQRNAVSTTYFMRYDPASDTWEDLSENVPDVDFKNGLAMAYDYEGNFYVLAGSTYADGADRVYFFKYNISTDTWIRLADTPHVQGAGDAITYSGYDGKIYAFIGRNKYSGDYEPPDGVYSVFARYDPNNDTWENLTFPPWPGTDDGASLAWTGGKYIYALEGEFYENTPVTNFARYDIDNDTWENMSDIPAPDGVGDGGSLLWIGYYDSSYSDLIFALDGNGCNETPGYNFTVYHISTDTWEELEDLPYPVGYYVGNRLAYARGKIFYWQGTPGTWEGGGRHICYYVPEAIPEMVFTQIPDFSGNS